MTWAITNTIVATRNITTTMPISRRNRYSIIAPAPTMFQADSLVFQNAGQMPG